MVTTALSLFASPGLSELVERARATLPAEALAGLDQHITFAERVVSEVFNGVQVWRLRGEDGLWVRAQDLAEVMEVDRSVVAHRVTTAIRRGELTEADIRRNVRNNAVDSNHVSDTHLEESAEKLTNNPRGVMLLSLRACRRLVIGCEGQRGIDFRDGLERVLEQSAATERALLTLFAAEHSRLLAQAQKRLPSSAETLVRDYVDAITRSSVPVRDQLAVAMTRNTEVHEAVARAIDSGDDATRRELYAMRAGMYARHADALQKPVERILSRLAGDRRAEKDREETRIYNERVERLKQTVTALVAGRDSVSNGELEHVLSAVGFSPWSEFAQWEITNLMSRLGFVRSRWHAEWTRA